MSFWKYLAPTVDSISSILQTIPQPITHDGTAAADGRSGDGDGAPGLSAADEDLYRQVLDNLLATPDLLSELKSGQNQRLNEFLASKPVALRLGGWVVWGLGRRVDYSGTSNGTHGKRGIVSDDVADGKVPESAMTAADELTKFGLGKVPVRRNMDENGVLEGDYPETEQEKSWAAFPRLCTEILTSDVPGLGNILFNHEAASSNPELCPSPAEFLIPFWEALLSSTEVQLETRAVQVGYWARVNGFLLNGPRGQDALAEILKMPHLLSRLLALLPFCSPINDLLLLMLRISHAPSPMVPAAVQQSVRLLDPFSALGKEGHVAAEEFLRGIIEMCSAAPSNVQPSVNGEYETMDWRDTTLARQIADGRTVRTLLDWMLADVSKRRSEFTGNEDKTPRAASIELEHSSMTDADDLRTSSLVNSLSVLINLIRKNNSDFIEQQMLSWARRKEEEATERELIAAEGGEIVGVDADEDGSGIDRGPPLVDLSATLSTISERIPEFQQLLRSPRSVHGPNATSAGLLTPLSLERFRICEFYAELLHCSNMSLLNRPPSWRYLYDSEGYLINGWKAADDLAEALADPPAEEEEEGPALAQAYRLPPSPTMNRSHDSSSSPIDVLHFDAYSGSSTPSATGSLDSESGGILTKAEAKELHDLVKAAAGSGSSSNGSSDTGDGEERDPFGDPEDSDSDADLAEATQAIELDEDLRSRGPKSSSRSVFVEDRQRGSPEPAASVRGLPPGPTLKHRFIEHHVIETMLDLFFDFPWNNFLHNVVFDILQQIFHGRLDRALDRQLALTVFVEGRLIERILAGQAANDADAKPNGIRLGFMGHMVLIAEEIVKLFTRCPVEIFAAVQPHIPEQEWTKYTETTLRETRDRDLVQLGGGVKLGPQDAASTASGISDDDDEFPMNSQRAMRAMEAGVGAGDIGVDGLDSPDQFSRYLQTAMSSDVPDKFNSSDEDDNDDVWGGEPMDHDFTLAEASGSSKTFGMGHHSTTSRNGDVRNASPDMNEDWGAFTSTSEQAFKSDSGFTASKDFPPTVSPGAFHAAFDDSFGGDNFTAAMIRTTNGDRNDDDDEDDDDDDFGDFERGASIQLPTMESLEDFDFDEQGRVTASTASPSARPVFDRSVTADDGSAAFGGLSLQTDDIGPPVPDKVVAGELSKSPPTSPSMQADLATTEAEPLGPSMAPGSHLADDGFVEAVSEVDGSLIRVPADDIVLAHRRHSIDSDKSPRGSLDGDRRSLSFSSEDSSSSRGRA
ncbi:sporulation-induced protein [Microbotryomycetes sp. JL201]|nr:sporulation-induced protein [Microbotryomycetes sp. JL201]